MKFLWPLVQCCSPCWLLMLTFSRASYLIPWRRKWQPTPVFLPGESHGLQSMGSPRVGHDRAPNTHYLIVNPLWWSNSSCLMPIFWLGCLGFFDCCILSTVRHNQSNLPQHIRILFQNSFYGKFSFFNQFSSVAQSCLTLCDPMDCSLSGFPVHHQLLEFIQTHVSSSVFPFSSSLQSCPAPGSFPMSQLFASGGHSTGVSASTSVLPMNTQDWSPLGWTGWISLQSKGLSRVFSNTTVQKHQFFGTQLSL